MIYISEIFTISRYWQAICSGEAVKLRENIEDIINFAEVQRLNISQLDVKSDTGRIPTHFYTVGIFLTLTFL